MVFLYMSCVYFCIFVLWFMFMNIYERVIKKWIWYSFFGCCFTVVSMILNGVIVCIEGVLFVYVVELFLIYIFDIKINFLWNYFF